jgi:hypothetical protein
MAPAGPSRRARWPQVENAGAMQSDGVAGMPAGS